MAFPSIGIEIASVWHLHQCASLDPVISRTQNHGETVWFILDSTGMLVGYVRRPKGGDEEAPCVQHAALIAAGVPEDRIFEDLATSVHDSRPALNQCLDALGAGDILVVHSLDRVGRNLVNLLSIINRLQGCGVGLRVLTGSGSRIDTEGADRDILNAVFRALLDYEIKNSSERTSIGLRAAKDNGKAIGKPRAMTAKKLKTAIELIQEQGLSLAEVASRLGFSRTMIYRYLDRHGRPTDVAKKVLEEGRNIQPYEKTTLMRGRRQSRSSDKSN